jgi:putative oxidoreductase
LSSRKPLTRGARVELSGVSFVHFLFSTHSAFGDLALLILRLFLGVCFIVHGLGKLGIVGPGNMSGFVGWLRSLGVPYPAVQARVAMLCELMGGVLIALGLLTRVAALLVCATMLVAAVIGHKGGGYLITNSPPGNEYALNLAMLMVVVVLLGPGNYSLDYLLLRP